MARRAGFPAAAAALVRGGWSAGRGGAVRGSAGVLPRLHPARVRLRAAAQGTAWLQLLRRPLQTLRGAPEPLRRRRQRRERGEAPFVQKQSAQSLKGNRLQTSAEEEGGGARKLGTRKAAGNERDRALATASLALPSHLPCGGPEWEERAGAERSLREERS